MAPKTIISIRELKQLRKSFAGKSLALVPTMGALHQGHFSLVKKAQEIADHVIVSIFVNPSQFGPNEDFARYPRQLQKDLNALQSLGIETVFSPTGGEMYPQGFQTWVENTAMANQLCGASRPGHFRGVCTVLSILLNIVRPDFCIMGKKDYQQWRIVSRMTEDLHLECQIVGCEIVRESDGLAMSSRNAFLSSEHRQQAAMIYKGLKIVDEAFLKGQKDKEVLSRIFQDHIAAIDGAQVDYAELRNREDLGEWQGDDQVKPVFLAAVQIGGVRLIDNIELGT